MFKYKLEGYDTEWIYIAGNQRFAKYSNLKAGSYTFYADSANNDGIWNGTPKKINIKILPAPWFSIWAYTLYFTLILGVVLGFMFFLNNRQKLKRQLELENIQHNKDQEINELKLTFFTDVAHEFKTPLSLVIGPLNDLMESTLSKERRDFCFQIVQRNTKRMMFLVNQLLDLSKLEAGKMTLETREQNIIPLLKGLVLSFTSLAERKKITLKFKTIEENLNVYIDKDKVEKIITNLLSNAFKFTPEGGNIDFTVEKLIKEAEIRISDNGIGIPRERIDKIFDRFYQVDGSRTRESEGTGIGLALTKELVELHKAKIEVESEEGKGTTLKILFPLGKDHLKPKEIIETEIKEDVEATIEKTDSVLEDEIALLRSEVDILKRALRNKIARHEISMIKKGTDVDSIID